MEYSIVLLSLMLCLTGCSMKNSSVEQSVEPPRTAVTFTHGVYGHIERTIIFPATTLYQNKSVITAPIPGFISEMFIAPGTRIKSGQLLYNLESKEQHAMRESEENDFIPIKSTCNGIVLDVQQQTGNYVTEGMLLCTIADSESLVFEIHVPYEQLNEVRSCHKCTLELPDKTNLLATIQIPLATMNTVSQSERVLASACTPFLPEGLHLKAIFSTSDQIGKKNMILPRNAVQSDETLEEHWVMKLIGDSTVVKVPIEIIGHNSSEIEVASDNLSPKDSIILTGSYGLADRAKVIVTKEETVL